MKRLKPTDPETKYEKLREGIEKIRDDCQARMVIIGQCLGKYGNNIHKNDLEVVNRLTVKHHELFKIHESIERLLKE